MRKNYLFNGLANLLLKLNDTTDRDTKTPQKIYSWLSLICLCTTFLFSGNVHAQTVLISPTGDGGFENGSTFAANGWTADTPGTVTKNQWFCGGAAGGPTPGFTATNCSYVTNNAIGTPPPHAYTTSLACVSHIYRDITVPAGETSIALDYIWIGNGNANGSMRVYLTPTTYTPLNGVGVPLTGTAPTGRIKIGLADYNNQATWASAATIAIPPSYAGTTFRVIFEWRNANATGVQPPAGIDNISLVSSTPTACIAPAQATAFLSGTKTTSTFPASFTGTASGYLVIQSTSTIAPTQPVDGITYSSGNIATLGTGLTFVQSSAGLTTTTTGLAGNTKYYYYIFAYNNSACTGGPAYATGGPLTGSDNTCPDIPNSVGTSGVAYNGFNINWATPTGGSAAAITYTVQVTTDNLYASNVAGSPFTILAPTVTLNLGSLSASTPYYYRILASNGCSSTYVTGSQTTDFPLCIAPAQANTFVLGTLTSTSVPASFSGGANGFLVIRSLTSTLPATPVNGTTYDATNIASLGAGLTVVQSGASTNIAGTGLLPNTQYFYFIYAYSATSCSGGPLYSATTPLTGNGTTPPSFNDDCSSAFSLTVNATPVCSVSSSGTTVGATQSQAGCAGTADDDVWYTFVATGTSHIVTVTPGTLSNAVFQVFRGTCGSLISVGCADFTTGSNVEAATLINLTIGTTYTIRVYSFANGASQGTFTICVTSPPPPPTNGTCATATSLPCTTSNLVGTTVNTTNIAHGTSCGMSNYGVWYTFTGDGNQTTITSTSTGGFDHEMSISSGSCGAFTAITCQDIGGTNGAETYTFTTVVGVNYYVYIADYLTGGTLTGTFTISRTCTTPGTPPINHLCSTATALPCGTSNLAGTTVNTTNIAHGTGCTMSNYGVWYTFTGDGNQTTITSTAIGGFDHEMSISSGSCGSFANIDCRDTGLSNGTETATFTAVLGTVYYVYIAYYGAAATTGNFIISRSCTTPPPPMTNDECSGAIALTPNPTCTFTTYTNATATPSSGIPAPGCANYSGGDVWFSVLVPTNGIIRVDTQSIVMTDGGMAFYTGACGSLSLLECDDSDSSDPQDMPYISRSGLTPGSTIYIRVWEYGNNNNGTFGICVTSPVSCTTGPGTGVSSLGCPSVLSGGLSLSGADPAPVDGCAATTCVDLEATYLQLGQTTSYTVTGITYAPPYQFGCLQNPVSVNVDDVWSPVVTLPFNFCFYGTNYNQCLVGSNGVLTFDMVNNTPETFSTWSFSNNLPSASLFRNTIFGVYHDIDPSVGGEVGYELITLNSGCRALVASWSNVPMFSDNTILYTGMMVLYENTNIIEVYIQEKRIDDNNVFPWNSGNALVGIQDATGTLGVAAPGRNSTDANWNTTNEAWRFTPSGTSITSLKWYEGAGTTGPVIGTTSTINVCPSSTTTYTAEISYSLCNGTTLRETDQTTVTVNGSKTWNGSVSTDWMNDNNWTPIGRPTGSDCVTIPLIPSRNPIVSATGNGLAGTLKVLNGATLTVNSNCALTVTDAVTVQPTGTFQILNNGSLVQINNTTNVGNIKSYRDASARQLDYVYWSSPVGNFNVNNIAAPLTPGPIYTWNTTVVNPNGGQGNWQAAAGQTMLKGIGYIVRAPTTFTGSPATINGLFTGVPFNGTFTVPIARGSDEITTNHYGSNGTQITNYSDNYNLLGNPYPSALRGSQFLFDNRTKLEGNIKLWTHGALPAVISSPFYNTFTYNYSAGDYLTWNFVGSVCCPVAADDLFIGSGQGFVVQMKDGPASTDVVTFNNTMRSAAFNNNIFYRSANPNTADTNENNFVNLQRHRIWLDIIDSNNLSYRTLVGYVEDATMEKDNFFDANELIAGGMTIYSLIGTEAFTIQGRALPFNSNDRVPLGISIPANGTYKIGIGAVDGLFEDAGQKIYLEDTAMGIIHDLRQEPYTFTANTGSYYDRFILRYTDSSLGVNQNEAPGLSAYISHEKIFVSASQNVTLIEVYDVSGKLIKTYLPKESNRQFTDDFPFANGVYLAKIKLENGLMYTHKLMN